MKKIGLLALGLALALGVVAEAGSIPADRVPLQTYAVKKMNCYLQPNGVQKGWIDPGDYVVVTQIRSDGWAYGSYPVGNGRVSRWFRADDLVNNIGFANQERYSPKANTNTYTGPDHSRKFGSFNDNETLLVVSESGESRQFIYKLNNGGYKMAWAPYWDCWDARQAGKQQVNNNVINKNPIVKPVQREDKKQEQSSSYGVWKATARYTANTYDNPSLSGARAGWVTAGSDLEVLGENAKSYFIRYWADNGAKRERYVERTAVKGLNEDKENKQQVNNNVINRNPIVKPVQREDKKQEQSSSYGVWKATARYRANTYDNPGLSGARAGWVTAGSDIEVLGENAKSYFIRYWADNGAKRERYVERTAVKGLNEDKENKQQEQTSYKVWSTVTSYTANTYDTPDLSGTRAGWVTSGSRIEVLGETVKSYYIRYWNDSGKPREKYVAKNAVKVLGNLPHNPIVKPVQREDKKQEQSSSYGVWKATARYRANTYDNPNLSGARAGWVTAGSDLEVLGENAKSYFIRYWADNGAKRERYVERTAVKGLNEDKENKKQVNNNVINQNPIVKPVQREDKKQEQSSSYGVWKATARYRANTYDNPNLSGARAGWVTAGSDLEVLGENAKSYFIRYWADNGAKRERYVERTAVKGLNEDKENKKQEQTSYGVWKATARYTANTYDNPDLRGMRAGRVTSGSDIEVLGENAKSYFIRYWADNGAKRERYVERTAVKGLNEDKDDKNIVPSGDYVWPIDAYKISCLYYYSGYNDKNKTYNPIKHDATYGRNPSYGFYYWNAMDIEAKNLPVKATADGTVDRVAVFPLSSYGPHIIIRHKDGRYSLYAHLKTGSILVKENQEVKKGQQIANSGYSLSKDKNPKQSWHLHFAITEVGAWQYFRDRVSLCYGNRVIGANKTQASKDNYSKDATEWFNKHNGSYKTY